jgi:precorrin-8X/cobalt-precorrin-8 methylmutase
MKPHEIEKESFRIILSEMKEHSFTAQELLIVQRVIHATADFDYQDLIRFSPQAIRKAITAIHSGAPVFSDVQMIAAGVSKNLLNSRGMEINCLINDSQVAKIAKDEGLTRSQTAMALLGKALNDAIILIGNAPTALFEVLRLYHQESVRPAFIVGVPVGFVNAAESKTALMETNLDYVTIEGRKGGSTVAVAIFNALLRLAGKA